MDDIVQANANFLDILHGLLIAIASWEYTIGVFCITLCFVFLFFGCIPTYKISRRTDRAFKGGAKIIQKNADDPTAFFEKFDTISQEIQNVIILEHFWREFEESTFQDTKNRRICLSVRPDRYFNKQAALSAKGNLNQVQAVPNYLIGIGLFFTFLGLASALDVAQAGLQSGDQQALQDLLKVASVKFVSSLLAIFLSLTLSFMQRWRFNASKKNVMKFCDLIELNTEYLPSEKLLMQSLEVQREQTVLQANMATEIATNLGGLLAKSLPDSVVNALQPLADEIRSLAAKFQGGNQDALQSVLQEFLKELRGTAGQDMDALVSSVQTLKGGLDVLTTNIHGLSKDFGQETQKSTALLTSTLQGFSESFTPIQQGLLHFGESLGALERIAVQIEQAGGNINGAAATNAKSVTHLAESVSGVSDQLLPMKDAMLQLQESLRQVAATAQAIQQAGNTIGEAATGFRSSANQIDNSLQNFSKTADRISDTVVVLDRASAQVSNASSPLAHASQGIAAAAMVMQQTETRLQESQEVLRQILTQIQTVQENMPRIITAYEQRFGKVDEDLSNAFSKLSEGSAQFNHSVKTFVTDLDKHFTDALSSLAGVISELQESQENTAPRAA